MPQRWEVQKPILPATNSSAASVGQGTVNCPHVTDPCGLVTSHIALCVWYLTGERIAGLLGIFLAIPIAGMVVSWYRSQSQEGYTLTEKLDNSDQS
jgi:hypothetical protein